MKKLLLLVLALISFSGVSNLHAQTRTDHLEPLESIFNIYDFQFEYYSQIRKVLFAGLSDSPEIRFQVLPSFSPESVLAIEHDRKTDKYYLVYHICSKMIWSNKNWENVRVVKYKKEIKKSSVESIRSLFQTAVSQTRYPEKEVMGLDGTEYLFSVREFGQRVGTVWSPPESSKMGRLVEVGYKLIELATNKDESIEFDEQFLKAIATLKSELE
jgi:hypothetical protein